jgi:drug/metabolite transporter (DMT)-like permease
VLATGFFVCMNTAAKVLAATLPTIEIVWARSLVHVAAIVVVFAPRHGARRLFATRRPGVHVLRSLLFVASTLMFFTALGRVPLADATAVSFTSPLIVGALAGPMLGERVDRRQWAAIAVGFVGALIIIRPTGGAASPFLLLVVGNSACYAVYQILTRKVSPHDRAETSVAYSALLGTLALSLVVPFAFQRPERAWQWALLASLGLMGAAGHYCVARALTWGPASIVAPLHYVQLVGAAALGYLVFADVPPAWTWIGAAVIVASGIYLAWTEARRKTASAASPSVTSAAAVR